MMNKKGQSKWGTGSQIQLAGYIEKERRELDQRHL